MHFRIGIVMSILYKKGKDTVKKTCQVIVKQTGTSQSEPTFAPEIKKATENNPILTNCYVADPAVMIPSIMKGEKNWKIAEMYLE